MKIGDPDELVITILGLLIGCWFAALVIQAIFERAEKRKLGFVFAFLTAFLCLILPRALIAGLFCVVGDVGSFFDIPLQLAITLAVQTAVIMKLARLPIVKAVRIATVLLMIWVGAALIIHVVNFGMIQRVRSSATPHGLLSAGRTAGMTHLAR